MAEEPGGAIRHGLARAGRVLAVVVVALVGAWAGLYVGARTTAIVGPFETRMKVQLSPFGQTTVNVPPLGSVRLNSHRGPLHVDIEIWRLRTEDVRAVLTGSQSLEDLPDRVVADLRHSVVRTGIRSVVAGVAGSLVVALLALRRLRIALLAGCVALGLFLAGGGIAVLTWNPNSILEPHYSGLLAGAPSVVGSAENVVSRFQSYRVELARLVSNVSRLYRATSTLPTYQPDPSTLRVLAVSDIHDNPASWNVMHSIVQQFRADLIVDTGDLTDHGSQPENTIADQISTFDIPYVYVRGNHDSMDTQAAVARQHNAVVLSGNIATVAGLRIIGDGDPRFTPDLSVAAPGADAVRAMGARLAAAARTADPPPDVAMIHDPAAGPPLAGAVNLVLAGHTHRRAAMMLGDGTRMLVEGSTGGAGLRALETTPPTPIECSMLYFDRSTRQLQAWDEITLGGLGSTSATIERHLAGDVRPLQSTPTETVTPTGTVAPTVP